MENLNNEIMNDQPQPFPHLPGITFEPSQEDLIKIEEQIMTNQVAEHLEATYGKAALPQCLTYLRSCLEDSYDDDNVGQHKPEILSLNISFLHHYLNAD